MHKRVVDVRKQFNLTQGEFAAKLGLTRNFISLIENGNRDPSDRTISDICREFNVSEQWLRTGEGEMHIELPERERLAAFFGDVLASAPDERSALISALAQLPKEGWQLLTELAREIVRNLPKDEE